MPYPRRATGAQETGVTGRGRDRRGVVAVPAEMRIRVSGRGGTAMINVDSRGFPISWIGVHISQTYPRHVQGQSYEEVRSLLQDGECFSGPIQGEGSHWQAWIDRDVFFQHKRWRR